MLENGIIEPIEQATVWCSGLTIAPRSNGKITMCVDLTKFNKGVKREIYRLPDILSDLSRGVVLNWMLILVVGK